MGHQNTLLWLVLLSILAAYGFWQIRENRQIIRQWQNKDPATSNWIAKFAWSRTWQILIISLCGVAIIIMYDWQLSTARQRITELIKTKPSEAPAAVAEPVPTPQPVTAPSPAAPANPVNPRNTAVAEVYNPEQYSKDSQGAMDNLKKRYEDILVTYFFLKKCNRISASDYYVITTALSQEMASINAPGRLQSDILTAAQGSYNEIYEQSSCEGEQIATIEARYKEYIIALSREYSQ